jgi:uncharacterized membrane protein YkvA (DUF1232 family)
MSDKVNEADFFRKVRQTVGKIPFADDVVALWFCMQDDNTPGWAKAQIGLALVYFISPIDAIPDVIVGLGYTDDAGLIGGCIRILGAHVTADHKRQAREWLS